MTAGTGWKATVYLQAQTVRVVARFAGYRGKYAFHCHNLEHEDMMMMANFEVVLAGTDATAQTLMPVSCAACRLMTSAGDTWAARHPRAGAEPAVAGPMLQEA
jgi:hypothetical protein